MHPLIDAGVVGLGQVGVRDALGDLHLALEAGEQPFGPLGLFGRQHLEGQEAGRAAVAGKVDGAHAALADGHDDLVRAEDESEEGAFEELAGLEVGEFAEADEVFGEGGGVLEGVGGDVTEHGPERVGVEEVAAAQRVEEAFDRGGFRARRHRGRSVRAGVAVRSHAKGYGGGRLWFAGPGPGGE